MLEEIVAYKKTELIKKIESVSWSQIEKKACDARAVRNFSVALLNNSIALIAEIKQRSPSKGMFRNDFNALEIAKIYNDNTVSAISVLGDEKYFGGGVDVVTNVANSADIIVPILFKDFILSRYQILEARASGADAVLLIVRVLEPTELHMLIQFTESLGMTALVETFNADEIKIAVNAGAKIIGINNRDLSTFDVNFNKTMELVSGLPVELIKVSESGISSREDIMLMRQLGFDAVLVGESILISENIKNKVRELICD